MPADTVTAILFSLAPTVLIGLVAVFGGALFLSAYLLVESYRCNGDVEKLLLGRRRAGA